MSEQWKDIAGYEGIYQASTLGQIRSVEGKTTQSVRHGERHWRARILKPKGCSDYRKIGYRVTLWLNKKPCDYLVARLVAATFLEVPINTNLTVNHINGDRLDNRIENLEWITLSQNVKYAFEKGQVAQNKTTLIRESDGKTFEYRSMVQAGLAIGKGYGYISLAYKKKRMATGKDGTKYSISVERTKSLKELNGW